MKYLKTIAMLLAAVTITTACKDDEEEATTETPTDVLSEDVQLKMQERESLATLLTMLTGQDVSPMNDIDFEGRTFEPDYGEVTDEAQPFCRAVCVRSAAEAAAAFRMLVGGNDRLIS